MTTRDALRAELERLFAPTAGPPRIGLEVELIPVDRRTRRPPPLAGDDRSALAIARAAGASRGWTERVSPKSGVPQLDLPCGGTLTFEPGAQLEYSAPPCASASRALALAREVCDDLRRAADEREIDLLAVGIDPETPIDEVAPQLPGERYGRMLAHFERIGPSGARMMRQTASVQLTLDRGAEPIARWRLLNALAPIVVATFANSPRYTGESTGHRSFRRHVWGTLDPHRTGLGTESEDPVGAYLDFALGAPAFLLGDADRPARPFVDWLDLGSASLEDWRSHLSTLFPEVRPREGYFELRSADAVDPACHPALVALVAGVAYHPAATYRATTIVGSPSDELLARAGRCGLADPDLAERASGLADLALEACDRLGDAFLDPADRARARAFFERYTFRGLSPADG